MALRQICRLMEFPLARSFGRRKHKVRSMMHHRNHQLVGRQLKEVSALTSRTRAVLTRLLGCLVLIITDAPLLPHQLKRIAQRAGMGLSQVSGHGVGRNWSGEFFMALSTGNKPEAPTKWDGNSSLPQNLETENLEGVKSAVIDMLFVATAEATEEAVLNAMTSAETMVGFRGFKTEALPRDEVEKLLKKHGRGYAREQDTLSGKL